jgi:hypothetical protein
MVLSYYMPHLCEASPGSSRPEPAAWTCFKDRRLAWHDVVFHVISHPNGSKWQDLPVTNWPTKGLEVVYIRKKRCGCCIRFGTVRCPVHFDAAVSTKQRMSLVLKTMSRQSSPCSIMQPMQLSGPSSPVSLGHLIGLPTTLDGNPAAPLTDVAAGAACGAWRKNSNLLGYSTTKAHKCTTVSMWFCSNM